MVNVRLNQAKAISVSNITTSLNQGPFTRPILYCVLNLQKLSISPYSFLKDYSNFKQKAHHLGAK